MNKNDTCWHETAQEAQLALISCMYDDLRQDHHSLIDGIKAAIVMLKSEHGLNAGIEMLETELDMRRCDY